MNNRKKIFASLLAFGVLFNVFSIPAFAADVTEGTEQIIRYEDGSYTVVTLTYDFSSVVSEKAAVKKTSGVKEYVHYNKDDLPLWTFRVHGSFEYYGSSAKSTNADYSQSVHASIWSFVSASAYCSGASAIATGNFKQGIIPISTTISLTCSADGVLS